MKKLIILTIFLFCFCVFANGGPVFDNKLGATGNVTFVKKANLQLLKEDLKIKIDGEKAHFQVRYTFQNIGGDTKIQFAFPMETNISDFEISDKEVKRFIEKEKVLSYKISKNGNDLKWLKKSETRKIENCLSADIGDIIKVSEWFISEIEFKKFEKAKFISHTRLNRTENLYFTAARQYRYYTIEQCITTFILPPFSATELLAI